MNKIKNIAHVTRIRIRCQSLVGFVTVFCLVHIVSHFFQGNLWHQILQTGSARLPMSQWLLRMVCPGSFAYLAKTILCQESILEQQPRLLTKRTKTPLSLPLVVIHKSRLQIRELRIQVVLHGASPQTRQCRPGAKRLTPEHPGKRLIYPDCDSCKTKHELIVHVLVSLAGTPLLDCNPDTWSTIRETSGEITRTTLRSTCGTVVRFNLKSNKNGTSWKQIDFP